MTYLMAMAAARGQNPPMTKVSPLSGSARILPHLPWHARDGAVVLTALNTQPDGLSEAEARQRLASHGPNTLAPVPPRSLLRRVLDQFNSALILVLLGSAVITAMLGHWLDTSVILGVVIINAAVGLIQEGRAERALAAISAMLAPQATVLREGSRQHIPAADLVPGDVVLLRAGDRVPADLRLIETTALEIDEATLTGESLSVAKNTAPLADSTPLAERTCIAHGGTLVVRGTAAAVVVATGAATEIGQVDLMVRSVETLDTPLLRQMDRFGRRLALVILLLTVAIFVFGEWVRDYSTDEIFLAAIGFAVAAIPEGLPPILTITLAIGVTRMARRHAIIRRLPAVETLGSVSVICTDKTGTLTRNELTVETLIAGTERVTFTGSGLDPQGTVSSEAGPIGHPLAPDLHRALYGGVLCNDAELQPRADGWVLHGTPVEGALLIAARKAGIDPDIVREDHPRRDALPFDSDNKYMAARHQENATHDALYALGAPEVILAMCDRELTDGTPRPIDRDRWAAWLETIAEEGQRVLALCYRLTETGTGTGATDWTGGGTMILVALFGLIDSPRPEAVDAVAQCRAAGIAVKMITGDHAATAAAIARHMNLSSSPVVLSGSMLDRLDDDAFARAVETTDVFARTTPAHKLRIVIALQASGRIVAMTGDGVNDAPALKRADIGIAMGQKGTEAAKEAAEMVLANDNFASVAHAIEEGRTVYANLRKAILYVLPTNGGEGLAILAAILAGVTLPITAAQILWINMITAVTLALALAFEPAEEDVMAQPPRRSDAPLLSGLLVWRVCLVSVLLLVLVFGLFLWWRQTGADLATARTLAVNALVMGEIAYLFNARRLMTPAWHASGPGNPLVWVAVGVVIVLQLGFTYLPAMNTLFGTAPLGPAEWAVSILGGAALFAIIEVEKAWIRRHPKPVITPRAGDQTS